MSLSGSINFLLRTDEEMGKTVMFGESLAGKEGARSRQRSAGPRPGPWRDSRLGEGCHSPATARELRSMSSWARPSAPGDRLPDPALHSGFCLEPQVPDTGLR